MRQALSEGRVMALLRDVSRCCVSGGVPQRLLGVALVVGTILNLNNQGDALFAGGRLDLTKLLLT
jgi:hypothetical protein